VVERKSIVMDAELAKEIAALMAKSLQELKPPKHVTLTKWLTLVGAVALVSGWGSMNVIVSRWNAIPTLQAGHEQAKTDLNELRETVGNDRTSQAIQMAEVKMQLNTLVEKQAEQKATLTEIDKKLDALSGRPIINPNP